MTTSAGVGPGRGALLSVNVGLPCDVDWSGRTVRTGIWKRPVAGPVAARRLNLDGDGQGDKAGHGGENRAVLVYQLDSYAHWQQHFDRTDLEFGHFGENFTVAGLPDDEVCVGDRYRIGTAEFEVTQPRVTCFRVGMRLGEPDLPNLLVSHRRPGFYLRVITEGVVTAGDAIELVERGRHALTVAEVDALLYLPDPDLAAVRQATDVPALSPGWRQSFAELLDAQAQGRAAAVPATGVEPGWSGFRAMTVTRIVPESPSVRSIHLTTADDGTSLPDPRPGQFLTVRIPGAGRPAPVRSYSLSAPRHGTTYRISVKRESGGRVSEWLHDHLTLGDVVEAAAPRGDFYLGDEPGPVVLVSAGIGITPVLAMLHRLAAAPDGREVWWLHTARTPAERAFAAETEALLRRLPHARARVFYTRGSPDEPVARLDAAALATLSVPPDATVYVCGPDAFMAAMRDGFAALGVDPTRIRSELFGALAPLNPGVVGAAHHDPHPPPGEPGAGPLVTFARSGLYVAWDARRYASVLELAEACDVPTRWSCRSGVCHTCVTPVLSGALAYPVAPLVPPAAGEALVCCSVPADDLVVDL